MTVRIIVITIFVMVLASCVSAPFKESSLVRIDPGKSHEECLQIGNSEKLLYSYYASRPLNFSIHDLAGTKVIVRSDIEFDDGSYQPARRDVYCMIWTNPGKSSLAVDFRYQLWPVIHKPLNPEPSGMGEQYDQH